MVLLRGHSLGTVNELMDDRGGMLHCMRIGKRFLVAVKGEFSSARLGRCFVGFGSSFHLGWQGMWRVSVGFWWAEVGLHAVSGWGFSINLSLSERCLRHRFQSLRQRSKPVILK